MKQYKAQAELAENEKSVLDMAGAIFEARGDYYALGFIEEAKGEALEAVTVADDEILSVLGETINICDSIGYYGAGDLCFELLNELNPED